MKKFAILRLEKLTHRDRIAAQSAKKKTATRLIKNEAKGKSSLVAKNSDRHIEGALKHLFREIDTPNADPNQTPQNVVLIGADNVSDIMQAIDEKMPKKVRANAVRAVEFFIGGSPNIMQAMTKEQQLAYFEKSLDFIGSKFGGRENIVSAVVHYDEKTPHLSVMLVPLVEKQLKASYFLDGKDKVRELQSEFAEEVGSKFGLERGIQRVRPRDHIETQEFYKVAIDIADLMKNDPHNLKSLSELISKVDYENTVGEIEKKLKNAQDVELVKRYSEFLNCTLKVEDSGFISKFSKSLIGAGDLTVDEAKSKFITLFKDFLKIELNSDNSSNDEKLEKIKKEEKEAAERIDRIRNALYKEREELEKRIEFFEIEQSNWRNDVECKVRRELSNEINKAEKINSNTRELLSNWKVDNLSDLNQAINKKIDSYKEKIKAIEIEKENALDLFNKKIDILNSKIIKLENDLKNPEILRRNLQKLESIERSNHSFGMRFRV